MINYEDLYKEVKGTLSEKRFKHSEGVVKRALEYAEIYNVDKEKIKLVAIAHDIAKEFSEEENQKYIREYKIELDEIEKLNNNLLHAKVGAYICKNKYNFTDDMTNAVMYHTTGRENMSMLEKVIYLADATEENRNYSKDYYVDIIKEDIDNGMVEVCKWVINHLMEKKSIIHLDTIKCYNYYTRKCEIGEKRRVFMSKHAIIVIKNNNNEYLQYYDERWNSFLFLNCKLDEEFNEDTIKNYISKKLKINNNKLKCRYIVDKIHTKFSESAQKEKEYHHFFYEIKIETIPEIMKEKKFNIDDIKYGWYNYDELIQDERIQKVNSDIVQFVKEFNL